MPYDTSDRLSRMLAVESVLSASGTEVAEVFLGTCGADSGIIPDILAGLRHSPSRLNQLIQLVPKLGHKSMSRVYGSFGPGVLRSSAGLLDADSLLQIMASTARRDIVYPCFMAWKNLPRHQQYPSVETAAMLQRACSKNNSTAAVSAAGVLLAYHYSVEQAECGAKKLGSELALHGVEELPIGHLFDVMSGSSAAIIEAESDDIAKKYKPILAFPEFRGCSGPDAYLYPRGPEGEILREATETAIRLCTSLAAPISITNILVVRHLPLSWVIVLRMLRNSKAVPWGRAERRLSVGSFNLRLADEKAAMAVLEALGRIYDSVKADPGCFGAWRTGMGKCGSRMILWQQFLNGRNTVRDLVFSQNTADSSKAAWAIWERISDFVGPPETPEDEGLQVQALVFKTLEGDHNLNDYRELRWDNRVFSGGRVRSWLYNPWEFSLEARAFLEKEQQLRENGEGHSVELETFVLGSFVCLAGLSDAEILDLVTARDAVNLLADGMDTRKVEATGNYGLMSQRQHNHTYTRVAGILQAHCPSRDIYHIAKAVGLMCEKHPDLSLREGLARCVSLLEQDY